MSSPGIALPTWVPVVETKPAPMPLLLVQSFVNTYEADAETDLLSDAETAHAWLSDAGILPDAPLDDDVLVQVRDLRESFRSLLVHNVGGPAPTASELRPLERLAQASRFVPRLAGAGLVSLRPVDGTGLLHLSTLLLVMRDAQQDGSWERLKACRNTECRWAFFDRSHARRGTWCDMAVCGNRIKNRNLRWRRSASDCSGPHVDADAGLSGSVPPPGGRRD